MEHPYEVIYILRPDLDADAVEATIGRYEKLVQDQGGTVEGIERWGRRKLAYEIEDRNEGIYTLMTYRAEPAASDELNRVMRISDDVIRHLIVRRDEE